MHRIRGRFVAINNFLISCRCHFSPEGPAPAAHLGDGCSDLVIIKECSRFDYVRHLFRCTKKDEDQVFKKHYLMVIKIPNVYFGTDHNGFKKNYFHSSTLILCKWSASKSFSFGH